MIRSFGGLDEKRTVQAEGDFAIFLLTMQLIISLFFQSGVYPILNISVPLNIELSSFKPK